jgi:hypothetical protein
MKKQICIRSKWTSRQQYTHFENVYTCSEAMHRPEIRERFPSVRPSFCQTASPECWMIDTVQTDWHVNFPHLKMSEMVECLVSHKQSAATQRVTARSLQPAVCYRLSKPRLLQPLPLWKSQTIASLTVRYAYSTQPCRQTRPWQKEVTCHVRHSIRKLCSSETYNEQMSTF